jgi:hypothetical protein
VHGWTIEQARAQPFEDLLLLAADAALEQEEGREASAPKAADGRTVQRRTISYTLEK